MTSSPNCPSCGSCQVVLRGAVPDAVEFAGRQLDVVLPGGSLYRCDGCGLQFRSPQLTKAALDALYRGGSPDAWAASEDIRIDWSLARDVITGERHDGDVLDIGCWDGRFLASLPSTWRRFGVEINAGASARAAERGISIVGNDVAQVASLGHRFDVVTAFDVIEHVNNPLAFLSDCAAIMRPGASLIIATGNTASLPWRMLGPRHLYCIWPEHLSFIDPDWCARTAHRASLEYERSIEYRRVEAGAAAVVRDVVKNAVYAAAPGLIAALRRCGVGKVSHPIKVDYPLQWTSAKDHFLGIFRKPLL